jgi:hypothetical protein
VLSSLAKSALGATLLPVLAAGGATAFLDLGVSQERKLREFLALKVYYIDTKASVISPTPEIDESWHSFLLFPCKYADFCDSVIDPFFDDENLPEEWIRRRLIDHNPRGALDENIAERREMFEVLRAMHFGPTNAISLTSAISAVKDKAVHSEKATGTSRGGAVPNYVVVKLPDGKNFKVHLKSSSNSVTIDALKQLIQNKEGIPADQLRLIFAGKQLQDDITLADYNIRNKSTIHAVLRVRGC